MRKYTVLWSAKAEQDLADIWLRATDRPAVVSAANSLESLLRDHPETQGESRQGATRVAFAPPLGAEFEVSSSVRIVYVLGVWSFGKPRN